MEQSSAQLFVQLPKKMKSRGQGLGFSSRSQMKKFKKNLGNSMKKVKDFMDEQESRVKRFTASGNALVT